MDLNLYVYDPRVKWIDPCVRAARARGWRARAVGSAAEVDAPGYLLALPHAHPEHLRRDQMVVAEIVDRWGDQVVMVADQIQVDVYENKRLQIVLWGDYMPNTRVFGPMPGVLAEDARELALDYVIHEATYPLVSKADVGASSYNVRVLASAADAEAHVREVFGPGVTVEHCDGLGTRSVQKDYLILQEFVPHDVTYRVNVIGRHRAVFHRRNFPDRPVAQTGNVSPLTDMDELHRDLLDWVDEFMADTRMAPWVALDVLRDVEHGTWRLLETSLRWPWPSPGTCNDAPFFVGRSVTSRTWREMWDVMIEELEAGTWVAG